MMQSFSEDFIAFCIGAVVSLTIIIAIAGASRADCTGCHEGSPPGRIVAPDPPPVPRDQ